jgi:ATP-binding protein involved in chromosome partitioning
MFRKVEVPILGVIENMAVHVCSNCGHAEHIFGAEGGQRIAQDYGVPLLASLPLSLSIREQTDAGQPTVVSDPASDAAASYLAAAQSIIDTLDGDTDAGGVHQFPKITISDD